LTTRERFFTSVAHKQPDKTPYHISFTVKARDRLARFYNDADFESKLGNCFTFVDFDHFNKCKEVRPTIFRDWFGVEWNRSVDKDIGVTCNQPVSENRLDEYRWPDPDAPELYEDARTAIRDAGDSILLGNFGFAIFERAWSLMGMENVLSAMAANKSFMHEFLDRILEYDVRVIRNACSLPLDGFRFGDDWGCQNGIIMGPHMWREFIKPRIKKLYSVVKSHNKFVLIHCCGKVDEILPDLIECGVDIFNPFQPEVMDIHKIKEEFGARLAFFGGISIQQTLPFGTVDETKNDVIRLIETIGKNGGYVAAPAHDVPADAKPENVAAMIEILKNQ